MGEDSNLIIETDLDILNLIRRFRLPASSLSRRWAAVPAPTAINYKRALLCYAIESIAEF